MKWPRTIRVVAALFALHGASSAQCLEYSRGFGVPDGVQGIVRTMATYDDGHGNALYLGGTIVGAGDVQARGIVKWDGQSWSPVGGGLTTNTSAYVNTMVVFDDGHGPQLIVGGAFTHAGGTNAVNVARWDGTSWSALGDGFNYAVQSLCVYDDGSGPALYAGGFFTQSGSTLVNRIARWNGTHWSPLAAGPSGDVNQGVYSMAVYDEGYGPSLFIGGLFTIAGGLGANHDVRWDGTHFSTLGAVANGILGYPVNALAVFDDGHGPALYVGGNFDNAGGLPAKRVAKWDGSTWSDVGGGLDGGLLNTVTALAAFDDGSGSALYAGGNFTIAGGASVSNIAKWNGASWTPLGSGVGDSYAFALAGFDDGTGPALFVGGTFTTAGGISARQVARWKNASWSAITIPVPGGPNGPVYALKTFNDGGGNALFVAGNFTRAGTVSANRIARWRNGMWTPLGAGLDGDVYALGVYNDGTGVALYAGGAFTTSGGSSVQRVAKWNGASWVPLGSGVDAPVRAFEVFNDGSGTALYAGGDFANAGGVPARGVARWKSATWSDAGGGVDGVQSTYSVRALIAFNGGGVSALYAGGTFTGAGGNPANNLARWDGSNWWPVGASPDGSVSSFAVFDFGGSPALFVGGAFHYFGAQASRGVAVWSSGAWWSLGSGLDGTVTSLCAFDDGAGLALYAGGSFASGDPGQVADRLAKWNGTAWLPLGSGLDGTPNALAAFQDASYGKGLYAAGFFYSAGALASTFFAEWRACTHAIETFCFGDGSLAACPCGVSGAEGRGCQNSAHTGGAKLETLGTTNPDTLVLRSSGELPHVLSIFAQSDLVNAASTFGDGWLCLNGTLTLFVKQASSGIASAPSTGDPSMSARSAQLGDVLTPGSTRYYQTYYRDPNLAFCPQPVGDSWNVSNGVKVTW
jgi:hypothetical protein